LSPFSAVTELRLWPLARMTCDASATGGRTSETAGIVDSFQANISSWITSVTTQVSEMWWN